MSIGYRAKHAIKVRLWLQVKKAAGRYFLLFASNQSSTEFHLSRGQRGTQFDSYILSSCNFLQQ